ncbi:GFA family protein [Neorhizobium petrolearium]|uniref:GFA family protein n=1 Tax=Neorhizobium petrolearium TaxID=515361 RepID=A0ABY8M486_9HYPH|nr:GFA family protein [Neorhizobium petrolearium]MCC2609140.1 GFA family protein [Neorhizobium petrolearium]WGI69370.1 GFA family protein [Neorhizobium petrolearium]
MERIATCACGKLQAICEGEPAKVSLCHCLECQRRTGSTYGIAAFFARSRVHIEGVSKTYARPSDSGFPVNLHFCPDCGSTVFWEPQRKPDAIAIGVGSFADPQFPAPSQAVYDQHRHPWVPPLQAD